MAIAFEDSVVVVTGASSGIGRATAHALARNGATVVLTARGSGDLEKAAEECDRLGGRGLAIAADMTDQGQVLDLADRVLTAHGAIDAWINNAAVTLFGRIEEVPIADFQQVVDTNLMGYVHGARAAIPTFREQGQGILVNVASVAGCVGQPYTSAYVATKWAIRGLSECLRMELEDAPDIHVCTVLPGSVDTPMFQHGANYSGRAVRPMGAARPASDVALAILEVLRRPRRETFVGANGALLDVAKLVAPDMVERRMAERVEHGHFEDRPSGVSAGNLYSPQPGAVSGGWLRRTASRKRRRFPIATVAAAALTAVPLGLLVWSQAQGRTRSA